MSDGRVVIRAIDGDTAHTVLVPYYEWRFPCGDRARLPATQVPWCGCSRCDWWRRQCALRGEVA